MISKCGRMGMMKLIRIMLIAALIFAGFVPGEKVKGLTPIVGCWRYEIAHSGVYPASYGPGSSNIESLWTFNIGNGNTIMTQPVINDKYVYFGGFNDMMYCLDKFTGKKKWSVSLGASCKNSKGGTIGGTISTPTVTAEDRLYFGTVCGKVMCLDALTGSKIWEQNYDASFNSPTVLYEKCLMVQCFDESLYGLDKDTGKKLWTLSNKGNYSSPPAVENGRAFTAYDKGIKCYNIDEKREIMAGKFLADSSLSVGVPVINGGKLVYAPPLGNMVCFKTSTGEVLWKVMTFFASTPCVTADKVYYTGMFGLTCLSLSDGKEKWSEDKLSIGSTSPVACGDRIYTADGKEFKCYNTSGKLLYVKVVEDDITDTITFADGCIYFGTEKGVLYCMSDGDAKDRPAKIVITPESKTVPTESTMKIRVNTYNSENKEVEAKNIIWTVTPKDMGSVSPDGIFTANSKTGNATITASIGGVSDKAEIEIVDVAEFISKIEVTSESDSVIVGQKMKLKATSYDKEGNVSKFTNFTWSISPLSAGKISQDGVFTPELPGQCTITAIISKISGSKSVRVVKISEITISPPKATVNFGKTMQFAVTVRDNESTVFEKPELKYELEPSKLGTIDENGLFTAGDRAVEGTLTVSGYGLTAIAEIKVEELKQAVIVSSKPEILLEQVDPGSDIGTKFNLKNEGNISDTVTITSDSPWMSVSSGKEDIAPNQSVDLKVSIKGYALQKNKTLTGKIIVKSSSPDDLIIPVKIVVNNGMNCFDVEPVLDFGSVSRGLTKTMSVKITFTENMKGTITSDVPWLEFTPNTFNNQRSLEVKVTVAPSKLPAGESFEGQLIISGNQYCREKAVKVTVKTENSINMKLTLGSQKVLINGNQTNLTVPPQVIKGNTMVPLRFIAEAFGCKVDWNGNERKITITRGSFTMLLWMDKTTGKINGSDKVLKAPPTSVKGTTLVPLRFIAEAFGATVNYNAETKEITIDWTPQ
jgi:outer membrane protein assembly factor BamB